MIISPDIQGQMEGSVQRHILNHLPPLPVDIVVISWYPNFQFVPPATKRYVLIDFMEPHPPHLAYTEFFTWVVQNPPLLTFKRELRASERTERVLPIEWATYLPIPPLQSKAEYDKRPLEVLFFWGYSHAQRPKLHGDIFREGMAIHGINVLSDWLQFNTATPHQKYWMSVYTPHWWRTDMKYIVEYMQQAKITVAMPGNGRKTFRHAECVGTLMALQRDDLAWAYPWDDTNSIQLDPGNEFQSLLEATRRTDLYDLYAACDAQMRKYEAKTYARDYVAKEIEKVL